MLLNPFFEGVILVVLGLAIVVAAALLKIGGLQETGIGIIGMGIGYFTHAGVASRQP